MSSVGELIRQRRGALGLSTRHLASLAGVGYPTISRVENGHEEPRWSTLEKLATALGLELTFEEAGGFTKLADLTPLVDGEPDWTVLRAFVDQIRLRPELTAAATAAQPLPSGSTLVDNLLAGIAERLAGFVAIRPPAWTLEVAPLVELWVAPMTPGRREKAEANTPLEFQARNIVLPEGAVWRTREVVG